MKVIDGIDVTVLIALGEGGTIEFILAAPLFAYPSGNLALIFFFSFQMIIVLLL